MAGAPELGRPDPEDPASHRAARAPAGTTSLVEIEDLLNFLADTEDLVTVVDSEGRFLWINGAAQRVFGRSPEECLGRCAFDFIHVEDRDKTVEAFQRWVAAKGTRSFSFENRQVHVDGTSKDLLWNVTRREGPDGSFLHLASAAHDVTAWHDREQALLRSELRLRAILNGTLDPLIVIDGEGEIRMASRSVSRVFGWRPEELIGQNIRMLMPEPHFSRHDEYMRRYRESGNTWILGTTREFAMVHRDGHEVECELSVSRVDVPGGEVVFLGSFRDVTARHEAERRLHASERRFRAIFDQEYQFVGLLDPDGTVLEVNRAALESAGVDRESVVGHPMWETPWLAYPDAPVDELREAVARAAGGELVRRELDVVTRTGERRHLDFSIKPLRDEDGRIRLLIPEGRDITELKRAQERETGVLRALAAIGESASILVHEIKNPITAVNLALQAVADRLGEDQQAIIQDLSDRMRKLERTMRRTLSFARPLDLKHETIEADVLLGDARRLLQPELDDAGIDVRVEVPDELPRFEGDFGLLEEVVLNLLRNAVEAMERGGSIALRARCEEDRLVLEVDDDGPGVPARAREHLFEPFHTTKQHGTGLGLALCRKVVEEHGGTIALEAGELGGACFRIRIPPGTREGADYDPEGRDRGPSA